MIRKIIPLDNVPTEPIRIQVPLKGICRFVQVRKALASDPNSKNITKAKPWNWAIGIVISILIFFSLAIFAWKAWSSGRKIAKLKHQMDVSKELKKQKVADAMVAESEVECLKLEREITVAVARIDNMKGQIVKLETKRKEIHRLIESITTWEDAGALLEQLNESTKSSQ